QPYGVAFAVSMALLFGLVIGLINGFLVTKLKIVAFITTLGMMTCIQGLLLLYTNQQPIPGQVDWFSDIGNGSLWIIPYPILIFTVIAVAFHLMLTYTRFGRNMYAAGGNQEACRLAGIKPGKYIFFTFVFSSFLSGLAGVLLASRLNCATIHIGSDTALLAVAASIMGGASLFGGRGSALGTFLGVLSLQIVSNGMNLLGVFTYYQYAIKALILIAVVVVDGYYSSQSKQRSMIRVNKEKKLETVLG
ncbi:MAG: ABC transporter permease, partial [Bacillota bacterium]